MLHVTWLPVAQRHSLAVPDRVGFAIVCVVVTYWRLLHVERWQWLDGVQTVEVD